MNAVLFKLAFYFRYIRACDDDKVSQVTVAIPEDAIRDKQS